MKHKVIGASNFGKTCDGALDFLSEGVINAGADELLRGLEDDFDSAFDNEGADDNADKAFDIDVKKAQKQGGNESCERDDGVEKGVGTGCDEGGRVKGFSETASVTRKEEFQDDGEDDEEIRGGGEIRDGRGDDTRGGRDDCTDASEEDNQTDDERGKVFKTTVTERVVFIGGFMGEFRTDNGDEGRKHVG